MGRDPSFRAYITEKIHDLRNQYSLPDTIEDCLAFAAVPGIPLAKLLIESYKACETTPEWRRIRAISGETLK